jgi:large subunit ribosomal protein L30
MGKLRITQVRSATDRIAKHRSTIRALGIKKVGQTVEHEDTPQIRGMVRSVAYLVKVEEEAGK